MIYVRPQSAALSVIAACTAMFTAATAPGALAATAHLSRPVVSIQPGRDVLSGVAATSPTNAWAVGCRFNNEAACGFTLIEQWNGKTWTTVRSPSPGGNFDGLSAVAATSAKNAWAVGSASGSTLVEHWTGRNWQQVPAGSSAGDLLGLAAISAKDIWAVGWTGGHTLTEHWDGTSWQVIPSPNKRASSNSLAGVAAIGPNNVWAVGDSFANDTDTTLVEHWNGVSWKIVPSPNPGGNMTSFLTSVSGTGPRNVWAVGSFNPSDGIQDETLAEHWDGLAWSVVRTPNPGHTPSGNDLTGVVAISPTNAWASGIFPGNSRSRRLIAHWNGKKWATVPIKLPSGPDTANVELNGIAAASPTNIWAVGWTENFPTSTHLRTWAEHWNGRAWTRTPSPNP